MVSVANSTNTGTRRHTGQSKPRYSHGPIKLTHQSPEACTSQLCTAPRNHNIHIRSHHNCNTIGATTTNDRYAVRGFCAMKRSNPTKPKLSVALARLISRPSQARSRLHLRPERLHDTASTPMSDATIRQGTQWHGGNPEPYGHGGMTTEKPYHFEKKRMFCFVCCFIRFV